MREIKFRAYHKTRKEIYDVYSIVFGKYVFKNTDDGIGSAGNPDDWEDVILLQYTGLKDKNGKEIYDGDIVGFVIPHETYKGYAVVFEEGSFVCYHTKLKDEYNKPLRWGTLQRGLEIADNKAFKGLIVIGNIYENPELLGQD